MANTETPTSPDTDRATDADSPLARGIATIKAACRSLTHKPGVYRMLDRDGQALYVGKAKNLRKRVSSYASPARLTARMGRMIAETVSLEVVTTHTEVEALLLESNLIKRLRPRYNIVLRDDKSFPYLLLTGEHDFPQVVKHRGARKRKGRYFGPFASVWAVNQTVTALQKVFLLRSCSDSVFASRTRPCLLHQIKRCSAPCVGRIESEEYAELVTQARRFLNGDSRSVQNALSAQMQEASAAMEYERAAILRDRIASLTRVQMHQTINLQGITEADVIAAHQAGGRTCVQVFFFRGGRNFGNRAYFPSHGRDQDAADVLAAFIGQFYDSHPPPRQILLSHAIAELETVADALSLKAERKVRIAVPQRGARRTLVEHVTSNARDALSRRLAENASQRSLLDGVARLFDLDGPPDRIEVYDNSHIGGRAAYGAMIVAGADGFHKNAYRKFAIRDTAAATGGGGDDYAMLREVLTRRFSRALKEDPDRSGGQWPDLVLIDGGAGHLATAQSVLDDLGIEDLALVAIAKGPDRDAGKERFFTTERRGFSLPERDPVLYFLQRLRDEAHRFAIGSHRARRTKNIARSALDEIDGVGGARKRALLHHFGSARGVSEAGLADLEKVEGISRTMARRIYDHFHPEA